MIMEHLSKTASKILATIIILFILLFSYLLYFFISSKIETSKPVITSSFIQSKLEATNTLSSVKYMYTNVGRFEDRNEFNGITIPFTQKSFVISYDGIMNAGISVDDILVKIDGNKIIIDIPNAKILSHEINENSIEVFDETKNIFNQISVSDYANFTTLEKQKMEKKAVENGILIEAKKQVEKSIIDILTLDKRILKNNEIVFLDFNDTN